MTDDIFDFIGLKIADKLTRVKKLPSSNFVGGP